MRNGSQSGGDILHAPLDVREQFVRFMLPEQGISFLPTDLLSGHAAIIQQQRN